MAILRPETGATLARLPTPIPEAQGHSFGMSCAQAWEVLVLSVSLLPSGRALDRELSDSGSSEEALDLERTFLHKPEDMHFFHLGWKQSGQSPCEQALILFSCWASVSLTLPATLALTKSSSEQPAPPLFSGCPCVLLQRARTVTCEDLKTTQL